MKVTADDVAQLLGGPRPRKVAAHVVKAAHGGEGVMPFVFGILFGSFGLVFAVVFFPSRLMDDRRLASAEAGTVPGVVTEVRKANLTINDVEVMEYGFRYTPAGGDGQAREGRCFVTGELWANGAEVTVRYLPAKPGVACIDGARLTKGGAFGLVALLFPVVGYGIVAFLVAKRRGIRRLLESGPSAEVDVLAIDATNMTVNDRRVYKITLSSPAGASGERVIIKRANRGEVELAERHAASKQPVFVLYDPAKPSRIIFPEALIEP